MVYQAGSSLCWGGGARKQVGMSCHSGQRWARLAIVCYQARDQLFPEGGEEVHVSLTKCIWPLPCFTASSQ